MFNEEEKVEEVISNDEMPQLKKNKKETFSEKITRRLKSPNNSSKKNFKTFTDQSVFDEMFANE